MSAARPEGRRQHSCCRHRHTGHRGRRIRSERVQGGSLNSSRLQQGVEEVRQTGLQDLLQKFQGMRDDVVVGMRQEVKPDF